MAKRTSENNVRYFTAKRRASVTQISLPDPPTRLLACACALCALRSQAQLRTSHIPPGSSHSRPPGISSGRCQPEPTGCCLPGLLAESELSSSSSLFFCFFLLFLRYITCVVSGRLYSPAASSNVAIRRYTMAVEISYLFECNTE